MAKKSSGDATLEWEQYWAWLKSDLPGKKEKEETIRYFINSNILGGMSEAGVLDCLEFAPQQLVVYLRDKNVISKQIASRLLTSSVSYTPTGSPTTSLEGE